MMRGTWLRFVSALHGALAPTPSLSVTLKRGPLPFPEFQFSPLSDDAAKLDALRLPF